MSARLCHTSELITTATRLSGAAAVYHPAAEPTESPALIPARVNPRKPNNLPLGGKEVSLG